MELGGYHAGALPRLGRDIAALRHRVPEKLFYSMGGCRQARLSRSSSHRLANFPMYRRWTRQKEEAFLEKLGEIRPWRRSSRSLAAIAGLHHGRGIGGLSHMVELTLRQIGISTGFPCWWQPRTRLGTTEPDVFLEAARRLGVTPRVHSLRRHRPRHRSCPPPHALVDVRTM